jgi:hypothetical protein
MFPVTANTSALELFRRAICERDEQAWATIVEQYSGTVMSAIRRHPAWRQSHEDDIYWINRAFQRFWTALGPERFEHFTDLPAIIRYLKMCAVSVLLDDLRSAHRRQSVSMDMTTPDSAVEPDHWDAITDRLDAATLWATVFDALADDTERMVARLSFIRGASPREIFARHNDRFNSVVDVYRVKRNLVQRLRREHGLHSYLRR